MPHIQTNRRNSGAHEPARLRVPLGTADDPDCRAEVIRPEKASEQTLAALPKDPSVVTARQAKSAKNGSGDSDGQDNYADAHSGCARNDVAVERWIEGRNDECGRDGDKRQNGSNRRAHGLVNRYWGQWFLKF